ncbi:MAG: DUF5681 domain-containing protein [Pseudolabrys sp.]|jgi:hypothetical protein
MEISMPFKKGQSGNPGGRPKILADVQELARAHTTSAINALVQIVEDKNTQPAARVAAANGLLDRGWGKARQALEMGGLEGSPIAQKLRIEFVRPKSQPDEH